MKVMVVAERLAKFVQGFGLGVQRFRPGAGEHRELVAQVDDAGAKSVQRRRVVAIESAAPARLRLPIGAGDRGYDLLSPKRAQVPALEALDDRV